MSAAITYVVVVRVALPVEGLDRHHASARAEAAVAGALVDAGLTGATVTPSRIVPLLEEPTPGRCRVILERSE